LEVRGLWVDKSLRGKGVGSEILTAIEGEARRRGATKAMLYTYSWQAEDFYKAHGYVELSRFDFPAGHYRIDLQKSL
jgi:GNAT superfamily N-acetyltransferase